MDVKWESNLLSGRSRVVANDIYELFVSEPPGFTYEKAACTGAELLKVERKRAMLKISLRSDKNGEISWSVFFISSAPTGSPMS